MQPVRGTKDLFGENILKYNYIIETAKKCAKLFNFKELSTPIFEFSDVFERNLGETSDVVMKEVYKFKDKGDNFISLRPEFTAGVARAIITNSELRDNMPLKLFSYGPLFRYDRPQMGRQRQFHQINFEYYGNASFYAEVNILQLATYFLKSLQINNLTLEINSLGSDESRTNFENALKEYFAKHYDELSEYSKVRLEKNVLRILDSKEECDKALLKDVPQIKDFYTLEDKEFFSNVLNKLDLLHIQYKVNPTLVRGLDYYTGIVFEFTTNELGTQSGVLGGGRYNKLMKNMGGADTPAVGFAGGVERLMLLLKKTFYEPRPIGLVSIGEKEVDYCLTLQDMLKENGLNVEYFPNGKVKQKFNLANKTKCKYVIVIGENEVLEKKAIIKDLDSGKETKIDNSEILKYLKER